MDRILRDAHNFASINIKTQRNEFENYNYDLVKQSVKDASKLGLASVAIPNEYGGLGGTIFDEVQVVKEMTGYSGSFDTGYIVQAGIGTRPIILFGNEEQKRKYVRRIASGDIFGSFALTEPDAGSDINNATTVARLTNTGYEITGQKTFISNAGWADFFIVFAKIDNDKNLSAFIVDAKSKGISLGPEFKKMGIRSSSTRSVFLDKVYVSEENLLGKRGGGFKIAMATLNLGRLKLSAAVLSAGKRALNYAQEYARGREQFGKAVLSYPIIKKKIKKSRRELDKLEIAIDRTARDIDNAIQGGKNKVEVLKEFAGETAILKVYASEVASKAVDESMQIMAGQGFMDDHPIEAMYRDSRITRIYEGTNEVCRLQALRYIDKLSWIEKVWINIVMGKALREAKRGPEHVSVRLFKLSDWLIKKYVR